MRLLGFEIYWHGCFVGPSICLSQASVRSAAMRVRQIIRSGGFEPQDVKLLDAVFDASWHQLQGYYPAEGTERDAARGRLASIVLPSVRHSAFWMQSNCRPEPSRCSAEESDVLLSRN